MNCITASKYYNLYYFSCEFTYNLPMPLSEKTYLHFIWKYAMMISEKFNNMLKLCEMNAYVPNRIHPAVRTSYSAGARQTVTAQLPSFPLSGSVGARCRFRQPTGAPLFF